MGAREREAPPGIVDGSMAAFTSRIAWLRKTTSADHTFPPAADPHFRRHPGVSDIDCGRCAIATRSGRS
jgi:hypothetical protein